MFEVKLIARGIALKVIADLKENIRTKAPTSYGAMNNTGQAMNSLNYRWEGDRLIIFSEISPFNYIMTLEYGRGPTKSGAARSSPTLQEGILSWMQSRGINPPDITQESLSYLIARKIHREGTQVWKDYGSKGRGTGIISDVVGNIDYFDKNVRQPLLDAMAESFMNSLKVKRWQ